MISLLLPCLGAGLDLDSRMVGFPVRAILTFRLEELEVTWLCFSSRIFTDCWRRDLAGGSSSSSSSVLAAPRPAEDFKLLGWAKALERIGCDSLLG